MAAMRLLPPEFSVWFWDQDFEQLSWDEHRNFIIRRLLQHGDWEAISWLRKILGNAGMRQWLQDHQGGNLPPRQLRFWELVLDLDHQSVNGWIESVTNNPWAQRGA